jgi:hypothetical protein
MSFIFKHKKNGLHIEGLAHSKTLAVHYRSARTFFLVHGLLRTVLLSFDRLMTADCGRLRKHWAESWLTTSLCMI